jgi:hypothetical protein
MVADVGVGRFVYTPILPPMADGLLLTKGVALLIALANFPGYLAGAFRAASRHFPGSLGDWLLCALMAVAAMTGNIGAA